MLRQTMQGASTSGGDMTPEKRQRAEKIILHFEERLERLVAINRIPRQTIRPMVLGSVFCGIFKNSYFVGYAPHLGMPSIIFMMLNATGQPSTLSFHYFLLEQTGHDFSVVELQDGWLDLPQKERDATLDFVASQTIQSEISKFTASSSMIPFSPIFGPNKFPIQEKMVFILMPFTADITAIYNSIVKPAIEAKGLIARRADDIVSNNAIIHDVWKSICEARFIVADLSEKNPNVMYELGIAHTVGKESILIHQSTADTKFPFDISHIRIINYANTAIGGNLLRKKLDETISNVLSKITSSVI